jgi:flagellar protein FlaI
VRIHYDDTEKALRYAILEPQLTTYEVTTLEIIERAFERLISTNLRAVTGDDREFYLRERFDSIISIFRLDVSDISNERMFFHLKKKYLGYGRIDTLMQDKYIEDISCNGSNLPIYIVHRAYGSIQTNISISEVELNNFVMRLAQMGGRHISLLQPIRDVTLPDGSRANITLSGEVTKKGSTFTIRKFRSNPISPVELMEYGTIDAEQLAYLWVLMEYKFSILVSGGTATGKTTLLNCLCSFIPTEYKIVSIEDTAEINLMHPNWVQSITRAGFGTVDGGSNSLSGISGISSKTPGDISLYDLLVAALRQRPEFIIVGEVRGAEAFTLFQAIAVGHAALGTIHAGSMDELLARVESNPMNVPRSLLINVDAVLFPVHIKKGDRGLRRMQNIIEVLELERESNNIITNTAYRWDPEQDLFRFQGRSYLFDKIKEKHGVPVKTLKRELEQRSRLLEWLKVNRIREYFEVVGWIRKYYSEREQVLAEIGREADEGAVTA